MSITELDMTIKRIEWSYNTIELQAIRAELINKLRTDEISMGIYKGLVKDISSSFSGRCCKNK